MISGQWPGLLTALGVRPDECAGPGPRRPLERVVADSRQVRPGDLFVCMPSRSRDTHVFLDMVAKEGVEAAVVHSAAGLVAASDAGLSALLVDPRPQRFFTAVARACRHVAGDLTAGLRVVGVTGTNGKTTTAWMVRHALSALGRRTAYLGTLGYEDPAGHVPLENTTPFPADLWGLYGLAVENGCDDLVMEASSHALFERRLAGTRFDVGVFTNLTQDHLDFHGSMAAYADAKKLLFTEYAAASEKPFVAALNLADPVAAAWAGEVPCRVLGYGTEESDLVVTAPDVAVDGITLKAAYEGRSHTARLRFGGLFNVENATSALAALLALGNQLPESLDALAQVSPVPGRFEAVTNDKGIGVIVDYAHTPDALEQLLKSSRKLGPARIITVFGCGGDRDRTKRPKMAAVVSANSDVSVVTSDNPRTEDPAAILAEVASGLRPGAESVQIIDRPEAITAAIAMARPGDLVVIAGKGHEDYQIIGRTKHPMDDRLLARAALEARP